VEEQPGITVRRLMDTARQASLATALAPTTLAPTALTRDHSGRPYVSLVLVAQDEGGSPVLLLSDLAEHSRNLKAEPRAALLYDGTAGLADPLTGPRASILGRIEPIAASEPVSRLKARFLARHPAAASYADFADFRLYRMTVERAHLIAGFGRIQWLTAADVIAAPDPTAQG